MKQLKYRHLLILLISLCNPLNCNAMSTAVASTITVASIYISKLIGGDAGLITTTAFSALSAGVAGTIGAIGGTVAGISNAIQITNVSRDQGTPDPETGENSLDSTVADSSNNYEILKRETGTGMLKHGYEWAKKGMAAGAVTGVISTTLGASVNLALK